MRVTYFGQACTLIEAGGVRILTDPWLTEGAYFGTWYHTHVLAEAGVSPETVPKDVDYIFLSHEHEDHLDPETLRHFRRDIPILICKFPTAKFRHHLESLGLTGIRELSSGEPLELAKGVKVTIFGTAEYTNDAALFVEGDGCTVFNETDCKLGYADLQRLGDRGIDIGFYMFSGANWYPMLYDYPDEVKRALTQATATVAAPQPRPAGEADAPARGRAGRRPVHGARFESSLAELGGARHFRRSGRSRAGAVRWRNCLCSLCTWRRPTSGTARSDSSRARLPLSECRGRSTCRPPPRAMRAVCRSGATPSALRARIWATA